MGKQRQRKLLSCLPCRQLKASCDRKKPCSRCGWRRKPGDCVYRTFSWETPDNYGNNGCWWAEKNSEATPYTGLAAQFPPVDTRVTLDELHGSASGAFYVQGPEKPRDGRELLDECEFLHRRSTPRPLWSSSRRCQTHWKSLLQKVRLRLMATSLDYHAEPLLTTN